MGDKRSDLILDADSGNGFGAKLTLDVDTIPKAKQEQQQRQIEEQQMPTICGYSQHMQQVGGPDGGSGSRLYSRQDWGARLAKQVEHFPGPAPYVIIHHSYIPAACFTTADCMKSMRSMQDFHQLERGWNDIGYSFGIGGDGMIYTGRGFNTIGAHAPKYNDKSVGIVLIGDWRTELPPQNMLQAAKDLIAFGVAKGYIDPAYKLLGHRQVRDTECPGGRLFEEISSWPHFTILNTTATDVKSTQAAVQKV
ncbi:peptidoglycan-recognition protein LB isoform X7 [Drosophila tropicalis]|uniref:peptidoglycan-recognition protein LB isoform X7 n=1 Tax=Drosophila tropicalis TaxID=46794 RepID=UPI0035AB82C8